MKLLEDDKIIRHSSYEPVGYVFTYKDSLYRAIYPNYEKEIKEMFQCGIVEELIEKCLFPKSNISEYYTTDSKLVIYHEKIPVITIPFEWSFSMMKEAALAVLKVNIIARKYGYQTKDSHGFNILFQNGKPQFIDLGSFVKIKNDFNSFNPGWWAYGEFMRFFYAPLKIWSKGDIFFARNALHGYQLPMVAFWRYKYFIIRYFPKNILNLFEYFYYKYKALNSRGIDEFMQFVSQSKLREKISKAVIILTKWRLLLFSSVNLERIVKNISKINPPNVRSEWGNYQTQMEVSVRHKFILNSVSKLNIKTILDLGGNAGLLARYILGNSKVEHIISADYDENAVDILYRSLQSKTANIYPVLLNFGISISDTKYKPAQERLRSELVMLLALTHHLILSQGMDLDFVFERIKGFTAKYVFIEFMPLGCYSSNKNKIPLIPEWYNIEWFRSKFNKHFDLIEEKQLELNRVLFIGQLQNKN